jgi:hypothetical protein
MTCEWYPLCDEDAIGHVRHPVVGRVPTCRRCVVRHDLGMDLDDDLAHVERQGRTWAVIYRGRILARHATRFRANRKRDRVNTAEGTAAAR